ncbi:MAG: hypothetical protein MRZ79_00895 [Bacteroidia bacterium]|nr:hypothetical protein [Bacteroidia bacterium]
MRDHTTKAYQERIGQHQKKLDETQGSFLFISYARLAIFLLGAVATYFLFPINALYGLLAGSFAFILFLYLVKIHSDIAHKRDHLKTLIAICTAEITGLSGDLSSFDEGEEFINPQHEFSFDLDIFGKNSIWQLVNRTGTILGRQELVRQIEYPEQSSEEISLRQKAIAELAKKIDWNLEFQAIAKDQNESFDDTKAIRWWVDHPLRFSKSPLYKILVWLLPALLGVSLLLWLFNYIPIGGGSIYGEFHFPLLPSILIFFIQLSVAGINLNATNEQQGQVGQKSRMLRKYGALLAWVEKEGFESELLKEYQGYLKSKEGNTASEAFQELADVAYMLDQRLNILMGVVLNGCFMWDIRQMIRLEKWRSTYKPYLPAWFTQIGNLDSLNSLGRFAFNHSEYVLPELADVEFLMEAEGLGHPLLDPSRRVDNDIHFPKPGTFIITTGANMAGKSTFLRTVGVNLVFAMMGLPVCARSFRFAPIEMMTSVRITDSIAENESFFYAELKRLKKIIDSLRGGGKPIFIIVDEMLRGTNSKDKTKGSRGFIEQLIKLRGVGMIATHDLSLGTLAEEYPALAVNKRFEVSITDDKLSFDYKFQDGISQNLNATFLMEQMGIIEKAGN